MTLSELRFVVSVAQEKNFRRAAAKSFVSQPALSLAIKKIENEKIKNLFGEALVSEIKLSVDDAKSMIEDCISLISKTEKDREEILKEKYNMQEITSAEKRELQQHILKKASMTEEDQILLKNLSSK